MASPRHSHNACLWLPRARRPLPQKKLLDRPGPFRRSAVSCNGCSPDGPADARCASLEFDVATEMTYQPLNVVVLGAEVAADLLELLTRDIAAGIAAAGGLDRRGGG